MTTRRDAVHGDPVLVKYSDHDLLAGAQWISPKTGRAITIRRELPAQNGARQFLVRDGETGKVITIGLRGMRRKYTPSPQNAPQKSQECPTPTKVAFTSRAEAQRGMGSFWRTAGRGKPMPTRVYRCPCGKWHLTSKPRSHRR